MRPGLAPDAGWDTGRSGAPGGRGAPKSPGRTGLAQLPTSASASPDPRPRPDAALTGQRLLPPPAAAAGPAAPGTIFRRRLSSVVATNRPSAPPTDNPALPGGSHLRARGTAAPRLCVRAGKSRGRSEPRGRATEPEAAPGSVGRGHGRHGFVVGSGPSCAEHAGKRRRGGRAQRTSAQARKS